MLSKLVKYDIKSLIRVFIPVWIVAPVIAVMLSATIHLLSVADGPLMNVFSEYIGPILLGILAVLFVAVIVGMMIMTLILVICRFWNGLLKEEGYLAFTLPVEVWQLIVSKVIVAGHCKSDQWSDCGTFLPDRSLASPRRSFTVWNIRSV